MLTVNLNAESPCNRLIQDMKHWKRNQISKHNVTHRKTKTRQTVVCRLKDVTSATWKKNIQTVKK